MPKRRTILDGKVARDVVASARARAARIAATKDTRAALAKFMSPDAHAFFVWLAKDAEEWNGTPLVGGNYTHTNRHDGLLTALKRAGLVVTHREGNCAWVHFTYRGMEYAASKGINLYQFYPEQDPTAPH